jgi:hypothetical protein
MRLSIIAVLGALALAGIAISRVDAAPTVGRAAVGTTEAGSPVQEARYVVRCHNVRVKRHDQYGHPYWTSVRRCHRHYY